MPDGVDGGVSIADDDDDDGDRRDIQELPEKRMYMSSNPRAVSGAQLYGSVDATRPRAMRCEVKSGLSPIVQIGGSSSPGVFSNASYSNQSDPKTWLDKEIDTRAARPDMKMDLDSVARRIDRSDEIEKRAKELKEKGVNEEDLAMYMDRLNLGHVPIEDDGREQDMIAASGPSPFASYSSAAWYITRKISTERRKLADRQRIRRRVDVITNPNGRHYCLGERRFKQMLALPAKVMEAYSSKVSPNEPITLDPIQAKFIEEFTFSCAALIYGDDWEANRIAFFREFGRTCIKKQTLCLSPRRFGKTWSLCIFILCLMICRPGIRIAALSQNKRTSEAIVNTVRTFLSYLPNGEALTANYSSETVMIVPSEACKGRMSMSRKRQRPDLSVLRALPCTTDGLRGTSADVILLEETAFMPRAVFQTVVVPIMIMNKTVLLAISTPNEEGNYYSDLLLMTDPKTKLPMFKTVMIGLVCDACRANGRGTSCPHRRYMLPSWHSHEQQELAKRLLPDDLAQQELGGQIVRRTRGAFEDAHIASMFAARGISFTSPADIMFLAIDPSGGSATKSQLAAIAGVLNMERKLVVHSRHVQHPHRVHEIINTIKRRCADRRYGGVARICRTGVGFAQLGFLVLFLLRIARRARRSAHLFAKRHRIHAEWKTGHENRKSKRIAIPTDQHAVVGAALKKHEDGINAEHALGWGRRRAIPAVQFPAHIGQNSTFFVQPDAVLQDSAWLDELHEHSQSLIAPGLAVGVAVPTRRKRIDENVVSLGLAAFQLHSFLLRFGEK